jgi:hypothetical protein
MIHLLLLLNFLAVQHYTRQKQHSATWHTSGRSGPPIPNKVRRAPETLERQGFIPREGIISSNQDNRVRNSTSSVSSTSSAVSAESSTSSYDSARGDSGGRMLRFRARLSAYLEANRRFSSHNRYLLHLSPCVSH